MPNANHNSRVPIAISDSVESKKEENREEPIKIIFPAEGPRWQLDGNAFIKKGPLMPAAKTFLNWAITDGAVQRYGKEYAATVEGMTSPPQALPSPATLPLDDTDFRWAASHRESILKEWQKRYSD